MGKKSANSLLHSKLTDHMRNLGKWNDRLLAELPHSWEMYNGFILFSSPAFESLEWQEAAPGLWQLVCMCLKGHSIALKGKIKNDSFRSPRAKLIYGESSIIHYLDNGVKYSWNVEKNMFSAGNVTERHRIASYKCENEVIVDLFAGIGYFTLPFLVHAKAKFVHACEWNPDAVEALRRNLSLNKVEDRCQIYEGDNRKVCPKRVANRVNLGLIPSSEEYWDIACDALIESGGILYIHNNVVSQLSSKQDNSCDNCTRLLTRLDIKESRNIDFPCMTFFNYPEVKHKFRCTSIKWKHFEWLAFSIHMSHILLLYLNELNRSSWSVSVESVFRVKSYAPHIDHLVYSVLCKPLR